MTLMTALGVCHFFCSCTAGTVVSHYPGLVTAAGLQVTHAIPQYMMPQKIEQQGVSRRASQVDFELMGGQIVRQRVPQDWVLLAATSREIKDIPSRDH